MKEHRFTLLSLLATFALLLVGGLVHPTGSSLACPDWPLCFGQVFPKMEGGVAVEHSHRLLATAIGVLTIVLAVMLGRRPEPTPRLKRLGWLALGMVILQGVLGGVTVLLKLPILVSTGHLALSMVFFALLVLIAHETLPRRSEEAPSAPLGELAGLALLSAAGVYLQIVLGAFVRHASAGLACNTTILTCNGGLWPTGPESGPATVHMLHRLGALVVGPLVLAASIVAWRRAHAAGRTGITRWAAAGALLVVGQVTLGILTVTTGIHLVVVEAHLGVGALLLAQQFALYLELRRERQRASGLLPGTAAEAPADAAPRRGVTALARDLVVLGKPRVTMLVVFTTGTGLALAPGGIGPWRALVAIVATSLVVMSANALNCWMERDVDALMNRTKRRPLPAGTVTPNQALAFGLGLAVVAVPALAAVVNLPTALLGAFALAVYVLVYTPLKRVSPVALVIGSVPGAIPPLMGWTAVTGRVDAPGVALFLILFLWQIPHFIAISLYLKDDYALGGLKVLPLVRGDDVARRHLFAWTVALVPASLLMVPLGIAGTAYALTALLLGAGFLWFATKGLTAAVDANPRWARQTFAYSLVYLTVLVGVLVATAS